MVAERQTQGKRAELFVLAELLKRGVVPYLPMVDVEGIDAIVRTSQGSLLTIQIKSAGVAGGQYPGWFQIGKVTPQDNFFIVCVEAPQRKLGDVWILPSRVFDAYAATPPKGSPRDLNLDSGKRKFGQPLREVLCGFRNRWELLTDYEEYEALLNKPEELEDFLAMQEALESSQDEMITLDEYDRRRKARV